MGRPSTVANTTKEIAEEIERRQNTIAALHSKIAVAEGEINGLRWVLARMNGKSNEPDDYHNP